MRREPVTFIVVALFTTPAALFGASEPLSPQVRDGAKTAVRTKSNDKGDKLTVLDSEPKLPAVLKTGQRLTVRFSYTLASGETCSIWARPYTNGKRTSGYGAHGSPRHSKGSGEAEGWFTFRSPTRIDQVGLKMVVDNARSEPAVELFVDVDARWEGDGVANSTASSKRYSLPAGGTDELLKFVGDMKKRRQVAATDEANRARLALKAAATRILQLEKNQWSEAYQTALRVLLEERIQTIRSATPAEQRKTVDFVKTFLTAKLERKVERQDVEVAISAAKALEKADNRQLAAEAYEAFATLIAKSNDETLLDAVKMMKESARRLQTSGKE